MTSNMATLTRLFIYYIGENGDSSLVVSLEINSVMYQGVLFAQPSKANNSKDAAASAGSPAPRSPTSNAVAPGEHEEGGKVA